MSDLYDFYVKQRDLNMALAVDRIICIQCRDNYFTKIVFSTGQTSPVTQILDCISYDDFRVRLPYTCGRFLDISAPCWDENGDYLDHIFVNKEYICSIAPCMDPDRTTILLTTGVSITVSHSCDKVIEMLCK